MAADEASRTMLALLCSLDLALDQMNSNPNFCALRILRVGQTIRGIKIDYMSEQSLQIYIAKFSFNVQSGTSWDSMKTKNLVMLRHMPDAPTSDVYIHYCMTNSNDLRIAKTTISDEVTKVVPVSHIGYRVAVRIYNELFMSSPVDEIISSELDKIFGFMTEDAYMEEVVLMDPISYKDISHIVIKGAFE